MMADTMYSWLCTQHYFKAMNTNIYGWLYSTAQNATEMLYDVEMLFNHMERRLSRFKSESELSRFNRSRGTFKATPTFLDALEAALWAANLTGGLFDPTILPHLAWAGYSQSFETISPDGPKPKKPLQPTPGQFQALSLNKKQSTITKPANIQVDLGGIGKGWTVDRAADRLLGFGAFLINAGGDLYAYGRPPGETGWSVGVTHPFNNETVANVILNDQAIATSSISRRCWQRGEQKMHHLIDPRTGQPADTDLVSVSVIASRTAIAEVLAKVALIIGAEAGLTYLESTPNIEAILITGDDQILQTSGFNRFN